MTAPNDPPTGLERRQNSRYRLVRPLTGFIEHIEERFPGSVLDLSVSGFLLYLPGGDPERFRKRSEMDFGEVVFGDTTFGGFGRIANVRTLTGGPGLGFQWDDYVYQESRQVIDKLIADLTMQRLAGAARRRGDLVTVHGHLSAALSMDIHAAITAGACRISLAATVSLDSSGLNILLDLVKSGVAIVDAAPEIREPLQRFRLLDPSAPVAGTEEGT